MKLILILALSMTALAAEWYCDNGITGDGGCEADGLKTYCCYFGDKPKDPFNTDRPVTTTSKDPFGNVNCGPPGGVVKCAPKDTQG
ncbi:hypothetical protein HYALB_00005637 [Hymenoscyphus albidus]|uniref:Hydrophobin n=1 Tax=Hymenoscyphus albidus TaxID=595503 RepID=A0A9N9Q565_9HELO|nr:hypothetical protein HYALB_00005637 [Hymenoscyphus albidus]